MSERPMTEERERSLELAQRIADAADWVSASDGASRRAAIRRLNGLTDNQYGVVQVARALLSTSSAERGMRDFVESLPVMLHLADKLHPDSPINWGQFLADAEAALSPKGEG